MRDCSLRFAFGANRKEQSASSCRLARLRRSLALDGVESRKTSEKKEETPKGVSSWQRMRDSMADLPLGQIIRSNRHRAADWQGSTGALHWMGSNPAKLQKTKKRHPKVSLLCWQRMRDSNPRKRSQSPVCYRYTNPLCGRFAYHVTSNMGIIAPKRKMSSIIFLFPRLFSPSTGCPHRKENMYRKEGKMKKSS